MAINVSQAFKRTSANPIDETIALTKAQMLTVNDNLMPKYYFTICQDDGKIYLYDKSATASATTGKFTEFSGGSGIGGSEVFLTTATLDEDINDTTTVLAADISGVNFDDITVGVTLIRDAKGTIGLVTAKNGTTDVTVTTATTAGHIILDNDGTAMPKEPSLQFKGLNVTDNSTDEVTEVESAGLNQDSMDDVTSGGVSNTLVANSNVYSTNEQVVGKWIDGKPIYQKTLVYASIPKKSTYTLLTDIDTITNFSQVHYRSGILEYVNSFYVNSSDYFHIIPCVANGDFYIYYDCDTTHTVTDWKINIQYTKTTD